MAVDIMVYLDIFLIYVSWWLVPLVLIFGYRKILSKYPIDVIIFEKRGENIIKTNDVAGRFENPINCYKLKMSKDSIPIPQYDWVLQNMTKPTNLFEKLVNSLNGKIGSIVLFKYGSKQYKPIKVNIDKENTKQVFKAVKNEKGEDIYIQVYEPINVKKSLNKLDFDVIDWDDANHLTQELRAIAMRRSPMKDFLEKHGAMIAMILAVMALIFAGYYVSEMLNNAGQQYVSLLQSNGKQLAEQNINKPETTNFLGNLIPGT